MRYHTTTRPVLDDDGQQIGFEQIDIPFTAEEEAEWDAMEAAHAAESAQRLISEITSATQSRLDAFARTRGYDGILSAATYATSSVPKFQSEGQYCVDARDSTWATLYAIMADVQSGNRQMPSGYADIEAELPALEWPI